MNRNLVWQSARAALAISIAALAGACTGPSDETQSIEGQVARSNFDSTVLGVRAVRGGEAIAWAPLTDNGHFRLRVPVGEDYRLEVVTASGAHPFVGRSGEAGRNLVFDVCGAGDAFDVGHVHGWSQAGADGDGEPGDCGDPCMEDPRQCEEPCENDPDGQCEDPCRDDPSQCEDPCQKDPSLCEDPCQKDPSLCEDPCENDPDGQCEDPCREDPSLCEWTCDQEGNCCYPDGTCCDAQGNCCYPDGTCCGVEGCCYPDGTCDPPPCDPSDPNGECYCDEQDPGSECYCNPEDPASYCYCNEQDPASYCYCNPEDPMSYCYPRPCEDPDGTGCCEGDNGDEMCWPEPGEPPPCDDGTMNEECWADGAVPENELPDFGCGVR